jgi:hypothetical protein
LSTLGLALTVFACRDLTAPLFGSARNPNNLLNPSGTVVVSPGNLHGWTLYNDQTDTACTDGAVCLFAQGPGTPPAGTGSAELATPLASDGKALVLADYKGIRFDAITDLHYATYRQSADAGNNLAIALQFNVDYDLTDQATGYQGRIVFEPYQGIGGNVPQSTWQTWDAKAGKWWGTKASVPVSGVTTTNSCVQATPCTWTQLLAAFPNIGVHASYGAVVLKAGSGWAGFRGNVDQLSIGVSGVTTTFDFELTGPSIVPALPPDSVPAGYLDSTQWVSGGSHIAGMILRDIIVVSFRRNTSLADRQSAIDLVHGVVVGGLRSQDGDGLYLVRVPIDGTIEPLFRAIGTLRTLPQVSTALPEIIVLDGPTYLRSGDGPGEREADWQLTPDSAFGNSSRRSWALEASNAPFAWGCSTGGSTRVGVIDMGLHADGDIVPNIDTTNTLPATPFNHGTQVASILAARGDDGSGITGMMWQARLDLRDVARVANGQVVVINGGEISSGSAMQIAARTMVQRHIRVVNISLGSNTPASGPHTAAQDSLRAAFGQAFRDASGYGSIRPLWVVSAGNMGNATDLYWESISGIADSLPDETLIVTAASASQGQLLHAATGRGSIDLAAPGENVAVMDTTGVHQVSGSSAATPLVSGTAGLLFAFDSTLTAVQARTYIKNSATLGGRTAGAYPMLDAYGALKLAAQRVGAPLCGNRVFKSFDAIVAMRGLTADRIIPIGLQTSDSGNAPIDVYHGGKRIDIGWSRKFNWRPGQGFVEATPYSYPGDLLDGGTFLSSQGVDHEYESWVFPTSVFVTVGNSQTATDTAFLRPFVSRVQQPMVPIAQLSIARPTTIAVVGRVPAADAFGYFAGYYIDANRIYVGTSVEPRSDPIAALAPSGKYAVAAVNYLRKSITADSNFIDCAPPGVGDMPPAQCASGASDIQSDHVDVYRVDLTGSAPSRLITTLPGTEIAWLAITEREDELLWQTVVNHSTSTVRYAFQGSAVTYGGSGATPLSDASSCTGKQYETHAFDSRPTATNAIGAAVIPPSSVSDGCNVDHSYIGSTVSPNRIPVGAGRLVSAPTRLAKPQLNGGVRAGQRAASTDARRQP